VTGIAVTTNNMACPGTGGGGVNGSNGAQNAGNVVLGGSWGTSILGGTTLTIVGNNGLNYGTDLQGNFDSISSRYPLISTGGTGGGGQAGTGLTGGKGGCGGFGSGGGGGGGSSGSSSIGGEGGAGGAGLIVIIATF
jgi:hypothetical protein